VPRPLVYTQVGSAYEGPLFHTGEFLLRAAVKASLEPLGHPDLWRSGSWKRIRVIEKIIADAGLREQETPSATPRPGGGATES